MPDVGNSAGRYTNVRSKVGPTFDKQTFGQLQVDKNMSTTGGRPISHYNHKRWMIRTMPTGQWLPEPWLSFMFNRCNDNSNNRYKSQIPGCAKKLFYSSREHKKNTQPDNNPTGTASEICLSQLYDGVQIMHYILTHWIVT